MSANLRFFQSMIRAERARVKRRPGRAAATPKPGAGQQVQDPEIGLGSVPEIVKTTGFPAIHKAIGGIDVTVVSSRIVVDWPDPDVEQAEVTSVGRRRPIGPGALANTVDFWSEF
ncbi:hypothetical protein [Devosia nitrariae]|uniref:Uncharacterized protein n=1 Tax=Devosia nitrariae TaxID=2071872 RepID=A0ABQ5W0T5_9HYPH|nr:hypothetical protein [Devosia nitrariae]GLQ53592.1 hypothetical protein GCM10010862_08510 [Devosia nitrariae]